MGSQDDARPPWSHRDICGVSYFAALLGHQTVALRPVPRSHPMMFCFGSGIQSLRFCYMYVYDYLASERVLPLDLH